MIQVTIRLSNKSTFTLIRNRNSNSNRILPRRTKPYPAAIRFDTVWVRMGTYFNYMLSNAVILESLHFRDNALIWAEADAHNSIT